MSVIHVNASNFHNEVISSQIPVLSGLLGSMVRALPHVLPGARSGSAGKSGYD